METNQKTHKPENAQDNENSDRLSCLHDAILFHIFSFLPTIYVVQSNILSKRWKTLWNSLPYLDFDDESVTSAMGIEHSEETIRIKLTNLLNNFLLHRVSSTIFKFRLSTRCKFDGRQINDWISAAIRAGVKELDVSIGNLENHMEYRLPSCLFNCSCLVTLKLSLDEALFRFPEFFCFPNLKSMHLNSVILAKNFHQQLLNCPNLETLYLNDFFIDLDPVSSSNPIQDLTDRNRSEILSNLDYAFIGVILNRLPIEDVGRLLGAFIRKLSNVKSLHLIYANIKLLQYSEAWLLNHLPTFCNLKHLDLEVGSEDGDMVEAVACLLQRSLVLQSLHLRYILEYGWPRKWHETLNSEEYIFVSMLAKLKKITLDDFWGTEKQIELVKLFFGIQRLEEIIIRLHATKKDPILLRHQLLQLPRQSKKLVLLYETPEKKAVKEVFHVNQL
ncbi:hypothetical protein ACOSQ2_030996 [Xanthoceras sorbifolium]